MPADASPCLTLVANEPLRVIAIMLPAPLLAIALLSIYPQVNAEHQYAVCNLPFCACSNTLHPTWNVINCTIPGDQDMELNDGDIPLNTTDMIIVGGASLTFGANSLSALKVIRQVAISKVKVVNWKKNTAVMLPVPSFYVDVQHCDRLSFEDKVFFKIRGPLSVRIYNCRYVITEGEPFSWVIKMNITNVQKLELGQGAFVLDPDSGNVGDHGPGLMVKMKNVVLEDIRVQTFGSSAAEIFMENVVINEIQAGAFSANTYNIVMAINCSIQHIQENAFVQSTFIENFTFMGCTIHQFSSRALQSAVEQLTLTRNLFVTIETGAINMTVATAVISDSTFIDFRDRGIELSSWTKLAILRNSFDALLPNAFSVQDIMATHDKSYRILMFTQNEVEFAHPGCLRFIGQALENPVFNILYDRNYFGQACHCNITQWLTTILDTDIEDPYVIESHCTVEEFFARCFNLSEPNMILSQFVKGVCESRDNIHCESFKGKADGSLTEIKNPRFPHKNKQDNGISDRYKKVIGIVVVTCLGCVLIVLFISFIRWMRRKGYCASLKDLLITSNSSCGSYCERFCSCGMTNGLDNARSISRLSVHEYSERHRLNEPTRVQEMVQETVIQDDNIPTEDKTTQTLPEELTKELLENLKEKLENPENYVEAREMIEHLYELTKLEECCNASARRFNDVHENIYELPFQDTSPRVGRNKKKMVSTGTRTPSLDKLLPLSPYSRQTALVHEYFEPKDFAVHLYAEIANNEKEKRTLLGSIPDVVAEQAMPRGPYLRAVREKKVTAPVAQPSSSKSFNNSGGNLRGQSTIKSTSSNSSGKMINRPLPEKPAALDPGEGTSYKHA